MTEKSPAPPKRPRWQSLIGTGILLLVVLFVYLRTGTLPEGVLDGVLGTDATVSAILQQTATPQATATDIPADTPTSAPPTETPTARGGSAPVIEQTAMPAHTTVAALPARNEPTATPTATHTATAARQPSSTPTATRPPTRAPPTATPTRLRSQSGLPIVLYNELPPEAKETIRLIDNNGPFPFRQDDATFQNREGILPRKPNDWYREFTVITPGSPDRGARRIIEGEDGVLFYTDDHYDSFREVIR